MPASSGTIELMRRIAVDVAWQMWGTFYSWGGDDPDEGFDCSGAACEILKSVGLLGRQERLTADGLARRFRSPAGIGDVQIADFVFWFDASGKAVHVEIVVAVLEGELLSLGASGGGPSITNRQQAIAANAFMKVRPVVARGGTFAVRRVIGAVSVPA